MDAKDLRTETALGDRGNDGNSKYTQASVLQNRNKAYHDIGSNSLANKVEAQAARPCAVIGPDRVVPPPAPVDAYIKKASIEPWSGSDTTYRRPPDYPHKLPDYNHPSRNISPRQTFQENMQRFMVPPSYNNTTKLKEDHNFPVDTHISPQRNKLSGSTEAKFCEVPYIVSPLASEQKNLRSADISVSSNNAAVPKSVHAWLPSSNIRPMKPYSAEVYQYPEYQNCAGPRPALMPRPHRTVHEEAGHVYNEAYYHDASLRYKPYPAVKERFPQARYEYVGNYSNPFHPPPSLPSHKYDVQKQLPPHPYSSYPQVPLKYMDPRMTDPAMNSYQRPINPHTNFNSIAYHNHMIHPQYGPVPGNCLQPNKFYPYPPDKSIPANKLPYDPATNKGFGEYDNMRAKPYSISETYYANEMMRHHPIKAHQVMPPNYPTVGMHGMPPHPYYRKDNPTFINYEANPHYRNIDPSINLNASILSRLPTQFSPNAIAISPSESNTSMDTSQTLGTSQEDFGYVSQSSSASIRSVDSGLNRMQGDMYRRYDYRYGSMVKSFSSSKPNINSDSSSDSKNKKSIDLRQYLQMWNEGEDENGDSNKKEITASSSNTHEIVNHGGNTNQEQLYVLGLVNVPSEELSKYEHIQKISKLPENIKGYNSIELLNQFEEVIESSNLNNYCSKPPTPRTFQISSLKSSSMQTIGIPSRPLSPLDVEAKISQSVIHKEVGCNFEIKPCSPKMLNVEVATPIQNVLGERVIDKVNNPVSISTPILTRVNDNISNCENIKHQEHRIALNDTKASSCKMVSSQYTLSENSGSGKSNYSLQDLESNSGVCLASLPRLDNDIELTFPEVNQQFINANKVESVITQNIQKDLPPLDMNQSEDLHEIELKNVSPEVEHEKEFSKLSKYRKRRKNSDSKDDKELNIQSIRTNSVIIKNPENIKCLEKVIENSMSNNAQDGQQDPINLTVYNDPRSNLSNSNGSDNSFDTRQDLITMDLNPNPSIEIDNKVCFVGKDENLRKEESCNEENVIEKIIEVQKPNSPKPEKSVKYVLETSVTNENKIDTNVDFPDEFSPIEEFGKIECDKSDSKKDFSCENHINNKQNIINDVCYQEESSLDVSKIRSENSGCNQLSECDPNVTLNIDEKVSSTLVNVEDKHEILPIKYAEEPADQQLMVNTLSSLDSELLKMGEEHKNLILPEIKRSNEHSSELKSYEECKQRSTSVELVNVEHKHEVLPIKYAEEPADQQLSVNILSSLDSELLKIGEEHKKNILTEIKRNNEQSSELKSNEGYKQQSNMIIEKNMQSVSGQTKGKECVSWTKVHKELYSPRLQNLLLCVEGIFENPLKKTESDNYTNLPQVKAENELEKSCVQISSNQFEVAFMENRGDFDSSLKAKAKTQVECLDDKIKSKDVLWDALLNNDQYIPATTEQHTQSHPVFGDAVDDNEIISTCTPDSEACNDQRVLSPNCTENKDMLGTHASRKISEDLKFTELLSTETENSKENAMTESETRGTPLLVTIPFTNDEHEVLSIESSVDKSSKFEPSSGVEIFGVSEDKCVSDIKIKTENAIDKDEINDKKSTFVECDEGRVKCEDNILGDSKDLFQLQCESSEHLDNIHDTEPCVPENQSNVCVEGTNNVDSTVLIENENRMPVILDDECYLRPIGNGQTTDKDCIDLSCEKNELLDSDHYSSSYNLTSLKHVDTSSTSSKHTNVCNDFSTPDEKVNTNNSPQDTSKMILNIDYISKSCDETVEILQELYPDVPKCDELTCDELSNRNSINVKFPNVKNKSLKRSFSDSALNSCNHEDQNNTLSLNKRKKFGAPENLQPQIITENYCSIIQNSRRNSISSIYNGENVSFCILIDNNCILTEDSEESDKFCYTEIPEHCLSCIESDGENDVVEESAELFSVQSEVNYDEYENLVLNEDSDVVDEQGLHETWVEDVACVETVVSDEVSEDIVVTGSASPKDTDIFNGDNDTDIFDSNEHTDKVKYIYGDKMCTNDAHLVETLYRTPQMDVNKTLINRESQSVDDCHQYYDEESLEKLLSESTNFQTDTGCSLSVLSPPHSSFSNTHTGLSKKPDLDFHEDLSFNLIKNSTDLHKEERFDYNSLKTQDGTVHSFETSVDDLFSYDQEDESTKCKTSSSPEVSSTTSEEQNSGILLKITNFGGATVSQVNSFDTDKKVTNASCKYTENKDYATMHKSLLPNRPLITKAAQKYIPPLKETIGDLKIKLPLPRHSLLKLKELKMSKEEPNNSINKHNISNCIRKEIPKKSKPKFEDVLKSIDELEYKMHKEKSKKTKKLIPKVVIKKNENGSHYTSTSKKDKYNPDLTGRKWQPWVFIEKNNFIDKMAINKKTKAIFSHRKNTFILAETFKKYKSITTAKFVISQPISESSSTGQLKYTIRLKHNY